MKNATKLYAALGLAMVALGKAEDTFDRYAENHAAKGTDDGRTKAAANVELADEMGAALEAAALAIAGSVPSEETSAEIARLAGIGLQEPENLDRQQIRRVCASALTQAPDRESAGS